MHSLKLIRDHVGKAPIALVLSGLPVLLMAFPEFGSVFEFHFRDFHLNAVTDRPWKLYLEFSWIGHLQDGVRILGCNWLHWSVNHLCWDLFMFYLIGSLCEQRNRFAFLAVTMVSGLTIPVTVMLYSPELGSYRGLSGIDTALYALLGTLWLCDALRQGDRAASLVWSGLIVAMFLKIIYELTSRDLLFVTDDSFTPAPTAHLTGALIGILLALGVAMRSELRGQLANIDVKRAD
jgi:rhomboid family GlyGly-CTERM serine protease